jgi:predicted PurR-regulated permease PerM
MMTLLSRPSSRVVLLVFVLAACFSIAALFPTLLASLLTSLLLAFVLKPFVRFLEVHVGLHRTISIASVFLVLGGTLSFLAIKGLPSLFATVSNLYDSFRGFPFDAKLDEAVREVTTNIPLLDPQTVTRKIHAMIDRSTESVGANIAAIASSAFSLLIIPFVTYFALSEGDRGAKRLLEKVPNKYFEMTLNVVSRIQRDLVGYLRGWLLDSAIVGVMNIIGYYMIGLNYPVLMGVVGGVTNLIPYVGPFAGLVPAFLVAVTQTGDLKLILPVVLVNLVVQAIDNIIVQPLCFAKAVDMHPLTVIVVLIVANQFMGVLGLLLAIPLYVILKVTAIETYWGLKHYRITS